MKLTSDLLEKIRQQLDEHFGIDDISVPKIKIVTSPLRYFQLYIGENRNFSLKEMIELDSDVELYYNDDIDAIVFKGFKRNGYRDFKKVTKEHIPISYLIHETIHAVQCEFGGYGQYDFFDEACDETVTYVLTGDIETNNLSDYSQWVIKLWNFMDVIEQNPKKKYKLIRDYNITEDKVSLHNEWLNVFLERYPKITSTRKTLVKLLEANEIDGSLEKILYKKDESTVLDVIYKLHDYFKPDLFSIFR